MKKFSMLASAIVLGAALVGCSSDEPAVSTTGTDGVVAFKVTMPGNLSRSINDGYKAVDVTYAVYDADNGNAFLFQDEVTGAFSGTSLETTINIQLVKGKSYNVAFFAKNAAAPYTITDGVLTIDYSNVTANIDTYDAFYGMADVVKVEDGMAQPSATLTRPFAQVNVGAADYEAAVKAGYTVEKTGMTFSAQIPNSMDMKDGSVSGATEVTYSVADLPEDDVFTVASKDYTWVAMNYVLASKDDATVNLVTFNYVAPDGSTVAVEVPSVPVKRNYRTNIVGSFFTSTVSYDIVIDPVFEGSYSVSKQVATASELSKAIASIPEGGSGIVTLTQDIAGTGNCGATKGRTVVLDLAGHSITINGMIIAGSNSTLEINNGTVNATTNYAVNTNNGTIKVNNVVINHTANTIPVAANGGSLEAKDVTINSAVQGTGAICVWKGTPVTLENVTMNLTGSNSNGVVINSTGGKVTMTGCEINSTDFALSTNASDGTASAVTIASSKLVSSTATAILYNVPGTLTITDSELTGVVQAAIFRGGTVTAENSTFKMDVSGYATEDAAKAAAENYKENWSQGNMVTKAAITFGNFNSTSYNYPTTVTLTGCAVSVEGTYASVFPVVAGRMANDKAVAMYYDAATTFTGGAAADIATGVTFQQK